MVVKLEGEPNMHNLWISIHEFMNIVHVDKFDWN